MRRQKRIGRSQPCDNGSKNWSDVSTNPGVSKIARKHPKIERTRNYHIVFQRRHDLRIISVIFGLEFLVFCYHRSRKPLPLHWHGNLCAENYSSFICVPLKLKLLFQQQNIWWVNGLKTKSKLKFSVVQLTTKVWEKDNTDMMDIAEFSCANFMHSVSWK